MVLDPMMGGATTLIESRLLKRRAIGIDINPNTVDVAKRNLGMGKDEIRTQDGMVEVKLGDARDLSNVADGSIDLVAAHPPYASIIQYSSGRIPQDLSSIGTLDGFFAAIRQVAKECLRVLRPGRHCAVLIGDTRKRGHYIPLSARLLGEFLGVGFLLRENVVKLQWNVTSEREKWTAPNYGFYKIAHEQLFVFRKPLDSQDEASHSASSKWW
jgi:DNA modification methylase